MALVGTIPGAPEEKDVHGHIGHHVDVGTGYYHERWRGSDSKDRGQGDIHPNVYGCLCLASEQSKTQTECAQEKKDGFGNHDFLSFHDILLK
jgi:hypothetical protein